MLTGCFYTVTSRLVFNGFTQAELLAWKHSRANTGIYDALLATGCGVGKDQDSAYIYPRLLSSTYFTFKSKWQPRSSTSVHSMCNFCCITDNMATLPPTDTQWWKPRRDKERMRGGEGQREWERERERERGFDFENTLYLKFCQTSHVFFF